MSYREKLRDTLEALRDYLPLVVLYGTLLTMAISAALVLFLGRADLEKLLRSSSCFFFGMMAFRR
jgi:hypothetical protein